VIQPPLLNDSVSIIIIGLLIIREKDRTVNSQLVSTRPHQSVADQFVFYLCIDTAITMSRRSWPHSCHDRHVSSSDLIQIKNSSATLSGLDYIVSDGMLSGIVPQFLTSDLLRSSNSWSMTRSQPWDQSAMTIDEQYFSNNFTWIDIIKVHMCRYECQAYNMLR